MAHLIAPDGAVWSSKHGYLKTWFPVVAKGLFFAALLAVLLVICVRLGGIERSLGAKEANQAAQTAAALAAQTTARERYETEMRELHDLKTGDLHDLKVSLNTLSAWYQEDVRNQYRNRR